MIDMARKQRLETPNDRLVEVPCPLGRECQAALSWQRIKPNLVVQQERGQRLTLHLQLGGSGIRLHTGIDN